MEQWVYNYQKKILFRRRNITQDKEGHLILIKASTFQKDIIILNAYTPSIITPKYMNQNLRELKEKKMINHKYKHSVIDRMCTHKNH